MIYITFRCHGETRLIRPKLSTANAQQYVDLMSIRNMHYLLRLCPVEITQSDHRHSLY